MREYIQNFRELQIKTKKLLPHGFLGNFRSAFKGNGLEFQEFLSRQEGEDIAGIDWLVSAREGKLLKRKMVEDRHLQITFVLDLGINMNLPFSKTKASMLREIFFMIGLSGVKNKDFVSSVFFGGEKLVRGKYSVQESSLFHIYKEMEKYKSKKDGVSLNNAIERLIEEKTAHNLIFVISDSFDFDQKLQRQLSHKNEIIFVQIFNNFENTLYKEKPEILAFGDGKKSIFVDSSDEEKRKKYMEHRKKKIRDFANDIIHNAGDYLYIDDKKNIFREFFLFMKRREKV